MDLRSTQKGLTNSIKRFRPKANVRVMGSFKGAVERSFSDRISNHWRVLGEQFVRPVRQDFRKPTNHFALLRWPARRDRKVFNYTFSPRIQLNTSFYAGDKVFFETKTNSIRQSWLPEGSSLSHAGERLLTGSLSHATERLITSSLSHAAERFLTSSLAHEFWTSLKESRDQRSRITQTELERVSLVPSKQSPTQGSDGGRLPNRERAFLLVSKRNAAERFVESLTEATGGAKPIAMSVPFHLSIPLVLQNLKQYINQSSVVRSDQTNQARVDGHLNLPAFQPASTLSLLRPFYNWGSTFSRLPIQPILAQLGSVNAFALLNDVKTGDAAALGQSVLRHLTISEVGRTPSRGASFTSVALTLAPKPAGLETLSPAGRRLDLSLSLSYARQDAGQLQAIVSALRELRSSQTELRTPPAPQLPSIEQLTREVRLQLERDIRTEKERRGL